MPLQGLGRLSTLKEVRVKPVDVPMHLRAHHVTTHSANLTWGPPIQLNPQHFKVQFFVVISVLLFTVCPLFPGIKGKTYLFK